MQGKVPATTIDARMAQLEAILNTAVAAIVTIDSDGIIESVNPATTAMFGYTADEMLGRNVKMLMPEPHAAGHDGYPANYLRTGVPYQSLIELPAANTTDAARSLQDIARQCRCHGRQTKQPRAYPPLRCAFRL